MGHSPSWEADSSSANQEITHIYDTVRLKTDSTLWRTGGEVKGKLANGVGSQ